MLEAYIIEQIRRKEQERLRRELETPPPLPSPPPDYFPPLPPSDRGEAIMPYQDEPARPDAITLYLRYAS